jgi:hypothetical protein
MATEVFAWGYVAWLTRRPEGYSLSGYIDGQEFDIVTDTPRQAERAFTRAARKAWLCRRSRVLRGLPAREGEPQGTADAYREVSLTAIAIATLKALTKRGRG